MEQIEAIEKRLWNAADTLSANSNYASNEYFLPVMGLVFLRHAYSCYLAVKDRIEANLPTRSGKARPLTKEEASPEQQQNLLAIVWLYRGEIDRCLDLVSGYLSLTPGRNVGVAPEEEDEDFDFEEALREIHMEPEDLNAETVKLAATIKRNFEELGI